MGRYAVAIPGEGDEGFVRRRTRNNNSQAAANHSYQVADTAAAGKTGFNDRV